MVRRLVLIALGLIAASTAGWHFFLQLQTIPLTEPMGMWETNYVSIAQHWPAGYQWGNFVLGHDNYGPAYPLFCRPFIHFIADIYQAHRIANLTALLAACGVLWWILRANRCAPVIAAAATAQTPSNNAVPTAPRRDCTLGWPSAKITSISSATRKSGRACTE